MSLLTRLEATGLDPQTCGLIVDGIESGKWSLVLKDLLNNEVGYAFKDDDIPILEKSAEQAAALLSGALVTWAPLAVASLVMLLYKLRKKRIQISALQVAILKELKSQPGLVETEIAEVLNLQSADSAAVKNELLAMTRLRQADGTSTSVVSQDSNGRWYAEGV